MIVKLTKKDLETIQKQRDELAQKYQEAKDRAAALRPEAPEPPTPIDASDIVKSYKEWEKSGSEEWQEAHREEIALNASLYNSHNIARAKLQQADDRLFKRITKSQEATVKELKKQTDIFLKIDFIYEEQDKGEYKLSVDNIKWELHDLLYKPILTLDEDHKAEIANYINQKIDELPPKVSEYTGEYSIKYGSQTPQEGTIRGTSESGREIPYDYSIYYLIPSIRKTEHETTGGSEASSIIAQPLDKRTVIITRLMNEAFNGKRGLERSYKMDFNNPKNRYNLGLYSADCPYKLKVAIDYSAIVNDELIKLPALTKLAKHIYNAIVSYWLQGNYRPSYRQIWRATCGNMTRDIKYGTSEKLAIERALLSFKASIAFSTGEIIELAKENNEVVRVKESGGAFQLLHYDTTFEKINGQLTDVLILNPNQRPILLEIAQALNNEYMTDNIDFFDVKGLASDEENLDLKEYIFIRIKKMKNPKNKVKQKKISLETLVTDLGIAPIDKTNPKDRVRKGRLVGRITKILDNAVNVNFIESYTVNKRKGSTEVISFTIEPYKKRAM